MTASAKPAKAVRCCILVPAFNEAGRIGGVVKDILAQCPDVCVIDDGSADATAEEARTAGAHVLVHAANRGKGAALNTGFEYARREGFEVVITMDADGQHAPEEIADFLEAYARTRIPVLIGNRMAGPEGMPLIRRLTNMYMSWLLSRKMGQYVADTQCGYRLYRTDVIPALSEETSGFAAESEILMRIARRGVRMDAVPIRVIYGDEKSKIRPVADTLRFFNMLRRYSRKHRA